MLVIVTNLEAGIFNLDEEEYLMTRIITVVDKPDEDGDYRVVDNRYTNYTLLLLPSEFVPLSEYCADPEAPTSREKSVLEMLYPNIAWED